MSYFYLFVGDKADAPFKGGSSSTCASGSSCVKLSDDYLQCQPNAQLAKSPVTAETLPPTVNACAAIPSSPTLTAIPKLPDPFAPIGGGARVATKADWDCRQDEISQLIQKYELGTFPGKPSTFSATFSSNTLTITCGEGGKSISFTAKVTMPSGGKAPYPAIIAYGGGSIPVPAGVAMINFNNDDIAAQQSGSSRGQGKFYTLYGSGHSAGATTAWAWGVSRIVDAIEATASTNNLNPARLGVTGCSRNGKGAMIAGALEKRIALTIPQESGSGGSACWRLSDYQMSTGTNVQTASEIVGENVWFSKNFDAYSNSVTQLPFDHHMLAGLVAPRGIYVIENTSMEWLGALSTYGCMKAAHLIWQALGVPDNMGYSQVGNHNHCQFPSSQQSELTAFVNKFLLDQSSANTAVMKTDGNLNLSADWIPWTTPTLT